MKTLLLLGNVLFAAAASAGGVSIGDYQGPKAALLSIDDYALPYRQNLNYYFTRPKVREEPVLRPSLGNPRATDSVATHFYGTVLEDGGRFRMWYYGLNYKKNPEHRTDEKSIVHEGPVCYAESPDGIHWTKPDLGQVEWNGSRDNNAIALPGAETEGAFLIKDRDDPDPARRYKLVYEDTSGARPIVRTAVSADGLHWTGTGIAARLLEPSAFYKFKGLYIIGAQNLAYVSEGGHKGGRQGYVWVSPDFVHWLPQSGPAFLLPEPQNPNDRGHDRPYVQVHLGVGPMSYGNMMVGLYCQWHAEPNPGDWFGQGTTYGNFGLVTSEDGRHFHEVAKGYTFLNRHDSPARLSPDIRTEEVLTQSGNGIINVGDETRIYHGRWMNTEKVEDEYSEVALATLPRDRWAALRIFPHASEGSVWSEPIVLGPGGRLTLNADEAERIRVEIADPNFRLIPGFSGGNAGTASGSGLDLPVDWSRGNLDSLAGRPIRLLFHLEGDWHEPRFYAAYVSSN